MRIGIGISPVLAGVLGGDAGIGLGVGLLGQATSYLNGVAPYHWFDFINDRCLYASNDVGGVSGATGYSFARASQGYYTNADGTLTSFASGALRRGNRGVLIEGARTNLLLRSQECDNASWSKSRATVTANAVTAPDGTSTADALIEDATAANTHSALQNVTISNATAYTLSVFVKANTRNWVQLALFDGTTNFTAYFDVGAGAVGTVSASTTAGITAFTNGWYRCRITFTSTNTAAIMRTFLATGDGGASYDGNGTSGAYIWGAQLEAGAFPSSYIPTTSASATRAGSAYLGGTTSGLDSAVSMWGQVYFPATTSAVQTIAQFDDGTANNRLILRRNASGNAEMELITGGVSQGTVTGGAMANATTHKIACSATANALRLSLNGTSATPDTSATMPTGLANIRVGAGVSIGLPSFAYHPRFAMFNSALSAANLDTVTT